MKSESVHASCFETAREKYSQTYLSAHSFCSSVDVFSALYLHEKHHLIQNQAGMKLRQLTNATELHNQPLSFITRH